MSSSDSAPHIHIRVLVESDVEHYRDLRLRALRESPTAFGSIYEREAAFPLSQFLARLQMNGDPANGIFGAFNEVESDSNPLVGMLGFMRESGPKRAHIGQLWGMYVTPEHRGQQIGGALLDEALAHAQQLELRQVLLSVNATNEAARSLYVSRGFDSYGLEPDALFVEGRYYDEEHMIRWLNRGK